MGGRVSSCALCDSAGKADLVIVRTDGISCSRETVDGRDLLTGGC